MSNTPHPHTPPDWILFSRTLLEQELTDIAEAIKRHEGCNIYGWLEVARVAGNIHFAVRRWQRQ